MNKVMFLTGVDQSPNIENKLEAQSHIRDVLSIIENYYTNID